MFGEKESPCLTPLSVQNSLPFLSNFIYAPDFSYILSIVFITLPSKPCFCRTFRKFWCRMESKALLKSISMSFKLKLYSLAFSMSWLITNIWLMVEKFFLKPPWKKNYCWKLNFKNRILIAGRILPGNSVFNSGWFKFAYRTDDMVAFSPKLSSSSIFFMFFWLVDWGVFMVSTTALSSCTQGLGGSEKAGLNWDGLLLINSR